MALDQSALLELLEMFKTADAGELMRRLLGTMLQELVETEATAVVGAGPHERSETRTTHRNGSRDKLVTTGRHGEDPQDPHRVVLPGPAGPAPPDRRGAARGSG